MLVQIQKANVLDLLVNIGSTLRVACVSVRQLVCTFVKFELAP